MKNLMFLIPVFVLLFSCGEDDLVDTSCIDIDKMCSAVLIDDKSTVEEVINKLTSDLNPNPTTADPLGQEANLITLIDRLNSCDCMKASLGCYGCLESFPVQSTIDIEVNKDGQKIVRYLRIATSETEPLKFRSMD